MIPDSVSAESPPIHFVVEHGSFTISRENELIVNQSVTVHLYCFFPKHLGQPKWETTSTYRSPPQTWAKGVHPQYMENDAYSVGFCPPKFHNRLFFVVDNYDRSTGGQRLLLLCAPRSPSVPRSTPGQRRIMSTNFRNIQSANNLYN